VNPNNLDLKHGIMIEIREATQDDSDALNELQRKCPMGTSFVLGVDSSPDYFSRSRPFKNWHVLVAAENNTVVGSAACAISDTYVEGKQVKAAYEYGFVVDPFHRRKGIAEKLQRQIEHIALLNNVDLLHLDITEDNIPSMNFFSKMGFEKVKDCMTISLLAYKRQEIVKQTSIRSIEERDIDDVVNLINETYQDYSFFASFQPGDFLEYIGRMPFFDFRNIFVLEGNEGIEACLGHWDYNKVRKYIVQKLNLRLKAQKFLIGLIGLFTQMPHIPNAGEPLLSYNLTTIAYKNAESITELVKNTLNIALENKINFIHASIDPQSPVATVLSQFRHTKIKLHFFTKCLKQTNFHSLREKKLYIDVTEM
jgi:ribosomal protein S18 acetylase RimI-like enzyme